MFPYLTSPYLYYAIGAAQLICIYHAIKTGRRDWMYLLIFLPGIGATIYFIKEILPGLQTGQAGRDIRQILTPGGNIKELERALRLADTDTNRLNLAAECARTGDYSRATQLVRSCLTGIYANSADTLMILARYLFHNNEFQEAVTTFEKALKLKSNRFDKADDELLYARALDGLGDIARAGDEYNRIIRVHHSVEGRCHYGLMLKRLGQNKEAVGQFQAIKDEKDLHPPHVRRMNATWTQLSARELRAMR